MLLVWNDLHEQLAFAYWALRDYNDTVLIEWNKVKLDRKKRELIITHIKDLPQTTKDLAPEIYADISWLIAEINALAESRNDAAHAPLIFIEPSDALAIFGSEGGVVPLTSFDNNRAQNLKLKPKLLDEYRWYRDSLTILRDYSILIGAGLTDDNAAWPNKPAWPNPKPKNKRANRRRRPHPKSHGHLPQS
jgi:hypothetical protein